MTTQTLTRPARSPSITIIRKILDKWAQRATRIQTERELRALSDRELNDIGISRNMISSIASGVYDARNQA